MSYPSLNKLVVSGSSLADFKHWLGGQPLDFEKITPIPDKLKETEKREGWEVLRHPVEFNKWVKENWGCRGFYTHSFVMTEQESKIIMIFETNKGPPIAALNTLSKKFPELTFNLRFFCYELVHAKIAKVKNGDAHEEYLKTKDPRFREVVDEFGDFYSCYNKLVVSGESSSSFIQWLGEDRLSLGKIAPIPESLSKQCGVYSTGMAGDNQERLEIFRRLRVEIKKTQEKLLPNPMDEALQSWCETNWGTQSEILDPDEPGTLTEMTRFTFLPPKDGHAIYFGTAWTPPIPVIERLSRIFPSLKFVLTYQCYSEVAGIFTFQNGKTDGQECDERHSQYHHVMSEFFSGLDDKEAENAASPSGNQGIDDFCFVDSEYISDTAMRLLSKCKGHLELCFLKCLSDEGAAALSEHDGTLSFKYLSYLTDNAAEALARHKGDIYLGGITELSDKAAESLAKHKGKLWFIKLETLSDVAATTLVRHQGEVGLFGLKKLPEKTANILAAKNIFRSTDALTDLSFFEAEQLADDIENLCLNGLKTLSDKVAEELAGHSGQLYLNGIETLSDTAAEALAKHNGPIFLNGLSALSAKASRALIGHGGVKTNLDLENMCKVQDTKGDGDCKKTEVKSTE